jgi:LuxR family maltose regulon positive regulatory protein
VVAAPSLVGVDETWSASFDDVPPVVGRVVVRQRLEDALRTTDRWLLLLCAPAGAGKTTLVRRWAETAADDAPRVATLTLRPRHDDGVVLLRDARAAVARAVVAAATGETHARSVEVDDDLGHAVSSLVSLAGQAASGVWLVLDDAHVVRAASGRTAIRRLVEAAGPELRVGLATRHEPAAGLEAPRASGALLELRALDLAFRPSESMSLLREAGVALPAAEVTRLTQRTEGWAIAVRIAASALESADDPVAFVAEFDGSDHAVADYLIGEVLSQSDTDLRDFLLRTSVCDRLPVDLARALSGRRDADAVLDRLEQDGLLTTHLGRRRDAYRYHELLRTYCLAELRRSTPEEEPRLHQAAADWWLDRGDALHALEHVLLAGLDEAAASILRAHAMRLLLAGRARPLLGVIERRGASSEHPVIAWVAGACAMQLGLHRSASRWSTVARDAGPIGGDAWLSLVAGTVGDLLELQDPALRVGAIARLRARGSDAPGRDVASWVAAARAQAALEAGALSEARRRFEDLTQRERPTDGAGVLLGAYAGLAVAAFASGDIEGMDAAARAGADLVASQGPVQLPSAAICHLGAAWCAYLRADAATTERFLRAAHGSAGSLEDPRLAVVARTMQLLVRIADGDEGYEALTALQRTLGRHGLANDPIVDAWLSPLLTWHALVIGERSLGRAFADRYRERPDATVGECALLSAQLAASGGRTDEVVTLLRTAVDDAAAWLVTTNRVAGLLLLASAELERGHESCAIDRFVDALGLAAPDRLVRPFLHLASTTRQLAVDGAGRLGRLQPFAEEVLERLDSSPEASSMVVPLTGSELEVLRALPSLLTLAEIAEARGTSVNTIKTHARAVYRKLGVSKRRDAVAVAREHGLLSR